MATPAPRIVDAPAPIPAPAPERPNELWRHRYVIAGAALAGAVIMGTFALLQPRQWEATVTLLVSPPKLGDSPSMLVAAANFVPVIESPAIAADVIKEFDLASAPRSITLAGFLEDSLFANPRGGGTTLIDVRVRLDSPDLAAKVANKVAERAVAASRQLSQDEGGGVQGQLKAQLEDAKTRYTTVSADLEKFRKDAQIETLRRDVEAMLKERGDLLPLSLELEAERAKLARAEKELSSRPKLNTVSRSIDRDSALTETARAASGGANPLGIGVTLKEELVNEVYASIDATVAQSRARVDSLEKRLGQAGRELQGLAGSNGKLARLYQFERKAADLAIELQIAQKAYELAGTQYENARLNVASRSAQLQMLAPAYPPEVPLSRRTLMFAFLGFVLAAALAGGVVWMTAASRS
jgi:uncharacterized protein involved in exopolysaccharide biosynthesis